MRVKETLRVKEIALDTDGPVSQTPMPGAHFVGFAASAQLFEKVRLEMDGVELQKISLAELV